VLLPVIIIPSIYVAMHLALGPLSLAYIAAGVVIAGATYLASLYCFDRSTVEEVRGIVLSRAAA
jgi:hypothetical protein